MSDAAIPLSFRPAQIELKDPYQMASQRMGLQQMAQATQLNAAKIEEERIKARNLAEDREDEQKIQSEFANPEHRDASGHMDFDKFRNSVTTKGVRMRNLQRLDADHQAQVRAVQEEANADRINQTSRIQQRIAQNTLIGQEISGLSELPDEAKPAFYQNSLARLKAAGVSVEGLPPQIPADGSFNEQLNAYAAAVGYQGKILSDAARKAQVAQREAIAKRAEATASKTDADTEEATKQRMRESAARKYLTVATPEQHQAWLQGLPPEISGEYANLKQFSPETKQAIQGMALTSEQRARNAISAVDKSIQPMEAAIQWAEAQYPGAPRAKVLDAALSRLSQTVKDEKFEPNAPGGKVDRQQHKEWLAGYDKAAAAEAGIYPELKRLEETISDGSIYVDEKGRAVPMSTFTKNDDAKIPAAIDAMKQRANALRETAKNAIRKKYDFASRLGFAGGTDVDEALRGIEEGKYSSKETPKPSPATTPTATPAPAAPVRPAPPAPRAATPAPQTPAQPAGTMTEAEARAKATSAGKDADWYVGELRKRNLIR